MKINKIIALAICLLSFFGASAQNGTMSPYSRYGYGLLNDNATSGQRFMGGVGYAMNSGRQINVMNPASYAAIDSLTFLFDMGFDLDWLSSEENGLKEHNNNGSLNYITMSFPIAKRLGASIGLLPFSSTGYTFGQSIDNGGVSRTGNGDINELYIGVGYSPFKNFYAGMNFGYLFGTINNDVYASTITGSTSLFQRYMRVRDYKLDFGVQYSYNLDRNNRLTLGATFSPGKSFHGETYGVYYDVSTNESDTTGYTKLGGKYTMPASYGVGLNWTWRERLMVEADFTYQPWKNVKYASMEGFESTQFDNRWKFAAGIGWTPQPRGSWVKRVQYRAGAYYTHDYLNILGNNVREYGVTVGFGLPVPTFKSIINLGFEYKHRQATPNPLIKENYFTVSVGINFNEMWFRKSVIY
ncbi:MAG: hypothetical protein NC102_09380 [Clostridium sp.]|nr:hypothetical protein [Clostridium sp.]